MAPEVIKQTGHGRQADIWSVGCTVVEMATAKPPWSEFHTSVSAMFHIASAPGGPPVPEHLSPELKDFVRLCTMRAPRERPNAARLAMHPFVAAAALPPPSVSGAVGGTGPESGAMSSRWVGFAPPPIEERGPGGDTPGSGATPSTGTRRHNGATPASPPFAVSGGGGATAAAGQHGSASGRAQHAHTPAAARSPPAPSPPLPPRRLVLAPSACANGVSPAHSPSDLLHPFASPFTAAADGASSSSPSAGSCGGDSASSSPEAGAEAAAVGAGEAARRQPHPQPPSPTASLGLDDPSCVQLRRKESLPRRGENRRGGGAPPAASPAPPSAAAPPPVSAPLVDPSNSGSWGAPLGGGGGAAASPRCVRRRKGMSAPAGSSPADAAALFSFASATASFGAAPDAPPVVPRLGGAGGSGAAAALASLGSGVLSSWVGLLNLTPPHGGGGGGDAAAAAAAAESVVESRQLLSSAAAAASVTAASPSLPTPPRPPPSVAAAVAAWGTPAGGGAKARGGGGAEQSGSAAAPRTNAAQHQPPPPPPPPPPRSARPPPSTPAAQNAAGHSLRGGAVFTSPAPSPSMSLTPSLSRRGSLLSAAAAGEEGSGVCGGRRGAAVGTHSLWARDASPLNPPLDPRTAPPELARALSIELASGAEAEACRAAKQRQWDEELAREVDAQRGAAAAAAPGRRGSALLTLSLTKEDAPAAPTPRRRAQQSLR